MKLNPFVGSRRQNLLDAALRQLQGLNSEDPLWHAQTLLARCLQIKRMDLVCHPQCEVSLAEQNRFADWLERFVAGEPLAYLEGQVGFYGREFSVDPRVLVPRADSECVVEAALDWMTTHSPGVVVDVGVGSGCLLLTLLLEQPAWSGVGMDCSAGALQVAMQNRKQLGVVSRCALVQGSWLAPMASTEKINLVISNPPYILPGEAMGGGVAAFEPHVALFAPTGGKSFEPYRSLLEQAHECLMPEGGVVFEVGCGHAGEVVTLAQTMGFLHRETREDLGGVPRAVVLQRGS